MTNTILKALTLTILANCTPAELATTSEITAKTSEPTLQQSSLDKLKALSCIHDHVRIATNKPIYRYQWDTTKHEPLYTNLMFTTSQALNPIQELETAGFTVETINPNLTLNCMTDSTSNPTSIRLPSEGYDFLVYTGECQTGYFSGQTQALNMADETTFIIVPSPELKDELATQLSCNQ